MHLEPGQLRLLSLISRHSSTSAAASELRITPTEVAQQLARAERDCGVPLVRRGPRGESLTAAGHLLARHGSEIDRHTAQATAGLEELLGRMSMRLRLGASQTAAMHLLPPALHGLRHHHPDADLSVVDLTTDQAVPMVDDGELDLAVIATWDGPPKASDHITLHPLITDPLVVVLPESHPLAATDSAIGLEQLHAEPWVAISPGADAREHFDRATAAAGYRPDIRFQAASYDVAQAFVATGAGVTLVPRLALTNTAGITHRELEASDLQRTLYAVTLADTRLAPLTDTFLHLLHDSAAGLSNR
ncbi:LysR family transcriptional regulator [Catenuloplanes japonicus]|uniref:LysR family transcriptional regulator n=1 Tax=Catenuloplanes japonicus TaxID=33876 RepID=UPI00068E180C|nr:LysR family transcriptional regulator [Catenuloplanes japonicus]